MKIVKVFGIIILLTLILIGVFYNSVIYKFPEVSGSKIQPSQLQKISATHFVLNNSWIKKNRFGNWECYVEGNGYERGRTLGILQEQLGATQEEVFVQEIENKVSSWWLRKFLLLGIAWFNRDLDKQIPEEYRNEIYGISEFFSDEFDYIGPKYNRIINYHAAHDIGHAVQNMHMVGCTAVGAWKFDSTENKMVVGRNFDFYFGDDFAKQKVILISQPDSGYASISVTWPSFIGVVSGMNEAGLGITLNSAKSEIPSGSGTPVSIIAREILQYAENIDEAVAISKKYTSFVSETFTISSLNDQKIVVIEKTPTEQYVYESAIDTILVTNHFQSDKLKNTAINIEHMKVSESVRRYERTEELMYKQNGSSVYNIASILRDQKGLKGMNIGMGNPLAINQLLAHHAVVFENVERRLHVSTFPFQLGEFTTYDLLKVNHWTAAAVKHPIFSDSIYVAKDPFLSSKNYQDFKEYKRLKYQIISATSDKREIPKQRINEILESNTNNYEAYLVVGNYYFVNQKWGEALKVYSQGLDFEIAYLDDKVFIQERIEEINKQLNQN